MLMSTNIMDSHFTPRFMPRFSRSAATLVFVAAAITTGQARANERPGNAPAQAGKARTTAAPAASYPKTPPAQEEIRPALTEEWLQRVLDATRNGLPLKQPEAFIEWLDAVSEPRFMTALATVAVDPAAYPRVLGRAIDPNATLNWSEFTDPALYLRWLAAGTNPAFFKAIFDRMANPGKFMRWVQAPQAMAPLLGRLNPAAAQWPVIPSPPATDKVANRPGQDWHRLQADGEQGLYTATRSYRY